jgi:hypothetical protein
MRVLSENMARRGLAAILALNAVAAAAAAIVLAVAPGLIPSIAGIAIDRTQNLVSYLLAAGELAIAALAALAIRSRSIEVKRLGVSVLIIFHAGSAVAGIAAVTQGGGRCRHPERCCARHNNCRSCGVRARAPPPLGRSERSRGLLINSLQRLPLLFPG